MTHHHVKQPAMSGPLRQMRQSLAAKLCAGTLACAAAVLALVLYLSYQGAKTLILKQAEENARRLVESAVGKIDQEFAAAAKAADSLALSAGAEAHTPSELEAKLRRVVQSTPQIYGCALASEPFAFSKDVEHVAPYVWRSPEGLSRMDLYKESYQYPYMDWYLIPKLLNRPVWSEPYFDQGGGDIVMCTYSSTVFRDESGAGVFIGVATADVSMTWLAQLVRSIKILDTGYAFIISQSGVFVAHPDQRLVMNDNIFGRAEERGEPRLRMLGRKMTRGESGFVHFDSGFLKKSCRVYYAPLKSTGWSIAVVFPDDELFAGLDALCRAVVAAGVGGLLLLMLVVGIATRRMTRPLVGLAAAAAKVGLGDFKTPIPTVRSRDEVGRLAASFAAMQASLAVYIRDLSETTAAKERIESELNVAREIQMGVLPKIFPPFKDQDEFEIFAFIRPAKAVGGDLYDFFLVEDGRRLCFAVGDVSGKGVPASLFMVVTQTLLRSIATPGLSPSQIAGELNETLCKDNASSMFVTYFLGILDIETNELSYCNCGHNPPLLLRPGASPLFLNARHGVPLGIFPGTEYGGDTLRLAPGDAILAYTDGVTEAFSNEGKEFGDQPLAELFGRVDIVSAREMVEAVDKAVKTHAEGAEQSDDITVFALRIKLPQKRGVTCDTRIPS